MKQLSKEEIDMRLNEDKLSISAAALFENEGYLNYEIYQLSDLPNNFISLTTLNVSESI